MKKIFLSFSIAVSCFIVINTIKAQESPSLLPPLVSYVESSSGLASPEWEGGRSELEFADMNGDGKLDFISIGDHGNPGIQSGEQGLMVFFGDGQGHWAAQMNGDLGYGGIAAGDVNNDGLMDVGYGMHHNYSSTDFGDQLMEVVLGDGTGTNWTPWDDGLATSGESWGMFGTDLADIDNDGDLDIGSISFGCCSGIHVYLNNLDGTWTQSFGFNDGNSDMIFQFGDIDNDGNMDFIAGHEAGTAYFGDGNGNFILNDAGLPAIGSAGRPGPSLGDVDNDGGMDVAFIENGGLSVFVYMEDIGQWADWSGTLPASGDFEMTQLADMDMDGNTDLAAFGNGIFQLFLGDGAGNWTSGASFTTGDPGSAQAFRTGGDIDHNGRPDIILLEEQGTWISYQNYLRCFKESTSQAELDIKPVYPHGHELLRPGSVRNIRWISTVPGNQDSFVRLEYSTTGPSGPWTLIEIELRDNGSYQWIVPKENSDNCYIRYGMYAGQYNAESITAVPFTITDGSIGINEKKAEQFDLSLFPNPAESILTIDLKESLVAGRQSLVRLSVINIFGQPLLQFDNIPSFPYQVDISALPPGLYIIRFEDENGHAGSIRFIKAKD